MSTSSSAEHSDGARGLTPLDIPRVSVHDNAQSVADGLARPLIYKDALQGWPAFGKWSIGYFWQAFGDHFGLIPTSFFDGSWGKAVKLRDYLDHLSDGVAQTPGFWVDDEGNFHIAMLSLKAQSCCRILNLMSMIQL